MGHSLIGASIAVVAMPPFMSVWRWVLVINIFILLSYLPDLPLPFWGHPYYAVSHSLFVNLALMTICLSIWLSAGTTRRWVPPRLFIAGLAAWGSHFLLDALYTGPDGVAIFWPFSRAVLNLPLPWFEYFVPSLGVFHSNNLKVFGIEAVAYLPILLTAVLVRIIGNRIRPRLCI
ncbi:MAG: hypothetical protein U5R49_05385 [Deltaproteobacteria bacterium]|nr:hypothetical protein [Deltaproteobacteria bacterium]